MSNPHRILVPIGLALAALAIAPVHAASTLERTLTLAPGGRLVVDTDSGSVTVSGTSKSGAHVVVGSRSEDIESRFTFQFLEQPGEVQIIVRRKGSWLSSLFHWGDSSNMHFEIEVPRQTLVSVDTAGGAIEVRSVEGDAKLDTSGGPISVADVRGTVDADTSGGPISIRGVVGDVRADTSGGDIAVREVQGNVKADTSGGSISIGEVEGDIDADTSGGSIQIESAGGRVNADTSGGSVTVEFAAGNSAGGDISSSGGPVRVRLDPAASLEIDASASGGRVDSKLPVTVRGAREGSELRGTLGSGGALLKVRASGGGIQIDAL